jgi:hypothetical protein
MICHFLEKWKQKIDTKLKYKQVYDIEPTDYVNSILP